MFRFGAAGSRGGRRAVDCDMIVVVVDEYFVVRCRWLVA